MRSTGSSAYANSLRHQLAESNLAYCSQHRISHQLSYGEYPVVVYEPADGLHGNFLPESYAAILGCPGWSCRLRKVHTTARTSLPRTDRRWCELDSSNSSDALLMNVFCYPRLLEQGPLARLLGTETGALSEFGFKARVPLAGGRFDRTEVDLKIGELLVESKLTEADFQKKSKEVLERYRDFSLVFNCRNLPQNKSSYYSYQLIRNVLAAHALNSTFCLITDARRPDLIDAWFAVMRCVIDPQLRLRCKVLTWQELCEALPTQLQSFLAEKYGIVAPGMKDMPAVHSFE